MKKNLFLILCIVTAVTTCRDAFAQVISPFSVRYQTTQKGGITFISNSASTCSGIGCGAGRTEVPPGGTGTNNGFTAAYIDVDSDGTTFMSSSDSLALANCSEILFAGLYWGGEMTAAGANYATRNQVKIKVNNGSYQSLTADELQDNAVGFDTYHCYKDVTSIIKAGGNNSRITIANQAVRVGGTNRFGGWSIVVVYKNDLQPMRTLSVFNGLSNVSGANPITDVTISGFLTPLSGPITFEIGAISYDGDRSSTGDQLMFNGGSGFVNVSDAVNPLNDVFNSTISRNGVSTPYRLPYYTNTLGYDADIFFPNNAAKNYIGNSSTSATIRLTTGGETYLTQVVTAAIDVYEPDLRAFVRSVDLNGGSIVPGDIIEYTIAGKNVGSDPSVNTYLENVLEQNLVYVPGSMSVTYGPNSGAKTDAAGDDQAEYIAAQRKVRVRIGTGANAVSGGQLNNSSTGIDSTQFKFRAMATTDCIVLLCDNVINNSVNIYGTGNVSGNAIIGTSISGALDGSGCFIPGSTNNTIVASCSTPTASSNSPVCTGNTISLTTSPASSSATYAWTGPGGFVSSAANPNRANATVAMAGTYTVVITVGACSYTATTTVAINVTPATPSPSSNSPVCTGNTINLSTAAVAGATYNWTGPSAFSSALQNPTRAGATVAMAGTYNVAVTANGCTSAVGTVVVVVNTTPSTPSPSSNSPVCTGNTINLSTAAVAGATYNWTGPSAFSSALQNPTRTGATTAMAGTYSVAVTVNGCTSGVGTTAVVVNTTPSTPSPSSNSPVCTGNTINLSTAAVAGATYSWTGPNSFSSSVQNPSITGATTAMAGNYSVVVTTNGCTSGVGTVSVIIDQLSITPASQTNVSCHSGTNGAASVTSSGGIGTLNYTWTPTGGNTANANGLNAASYTVTVSDANGCTATQTFIITEPTALVASSNSTPIICNGGTSAITVSATGGTPGYTGTGTHTVTAGTYTYAVSDANGCTSSTSITVSEPSLISGSQIFVECQGFSVTVGSNTYTATGVYTDVLTAVNGCDSTVTTNLTIKQPSVFTQTFVECQGFSVTVGSNTYNATGIYTDVLTAVNGCDSTVTTDLTIKQPSVFTQTFVECQGFSVTVGSNTYSATGIYTDVLTAVNGCDSTVTTDLTIKQPSAFTQTFVECQGFSVTVGSNTYNATGIYTDVLTAVNGCDSTVTTDLTIQNAIDNSVTLNGATITANAVGLSYQWIDCDNGNSIISGEINQAYTATVNGNYAVIITSGSCSVTSSCQSVIVTGLQNLQADNSIRVFPNPFNDVVSISYANPLNTSIHIEVFNAIGQKVHSAEMTGDTINLNLETLDTGMYFVKVITDKQESITRLIKQ